MRPRLRKSVDVEPRLARWNEGRSTLTRVFGFCFCPSKRKSGRPGSATAVPTHRRRPSSAAAGHLAVDRSRVLLLCPWGHEPKERADTAASRERLETTVPHSRTTGILIGRWVPASDFSYSIHEGNSRSVGDVAAQATMRQSLERAFRNGRSHRGRPGPSASGVRRISRVARFLDHDLEVEDRGAVDRL